MCGIAGWIDYNLDLRNHEDIINKMTGTLVRRGPDAQGIHLKENVCLMHRRLIVIDPVNGIQPMTKEKGNTGYTIVYNGELYNTNELRGELLAFGYHFRGHSDTEVLLTAFIHWGESCLERLNGIYAFGVWNDTGKTLFLARDRMGVKPLFVYNYPDGIIFGSELKTLLANPLVKPRVDNNGLKEIFLLGPGRTSGNGVIKGVTELKPAEFLVFEQKTGLKVRKYWSLKAGEHTDDVKTTIEKTRFLITDAVKRQLVSDVPLCCFLSGGLDSSIISKIASDEYLSGSKGRLHTYSVNYVDNDQYFVKNIFQPNSDEKYIRMMVNEIGSQHHEVLLDNEDLEKHLGDAAFARDLPGMADVDSSLLMFCREIKKEFTVAVSGECADEIFGGYPWYQDEKIRNEQSFPWSKSIDYRSSFLNDCITEKINAEEYVSQRYNKTVSEADKVVNISELESRMKEMMKLNLDWFMQTLLDRKDRMSMYNGLEVRVPFCDYRIAEYLYTVPWEFKNYQNREKGLLRKAMEDILPEEIAWRKKSPYPKTHNPAYLKAVSDLLHGIIAKPYSPILQILKKEEIENLLKSTSQTPWYGQLMTVPQTIAYFVQLNYWLEKYDIKIV